VIWGRLVFGEGDLRRRLPAVVLMLGGVLLIMLT
jgi:hypothetical protein